MDSQNENELLQKVRTALRLKHEKLDGEISDLIEACKADLRISGVNVISESDPLIVRAVTVYCKANFGLENADSGKYEQSYEMLKHHLALSGDYNV